MRLKFNELIIRDFKSFAGTHRLVLDRPIGMYFVRGRNRIERRLGSNGSGKSSIWDAFVWCLYGRTPGGLRNGDIIPWVGKNTRPRIALLVRVGDRDHKIVRMTNPNTLMIDGKDVGPEAVTQLIGMSFEVMTNTIILGQGQPLFFDMTPAKKMQLLSDVKGLERWDERSKRAANKVAELEDELIEIKNEEKLLAQLLHDCTVDLKAIRKQEDEWQAAFEARHEKAEREHKVIGKKIEAMSNVVGSLDLKYDGAGTEAKACQRQADELIVEAAKARTNLSIALASRERARRDGLDKQAELDGLKVAEHCPTCGQVIRSGDLRKHRNELKQKIEASEEVLRMVRTKPLRAVVEMLDIRLASVKSYLLSFTAAADGALRELQQKRGELGELIAKRKAIETILDETTTNPHTKQSHVLRERRKTLQADQLIVMRDMQGCAKELEQVKYWPKGFKDIKLHVIEELLQEIELTTDGLLEEFGLIGWRIKYAIERETKSGSTQHALSVLIGSPTSKGKLVKWESWSGGEGQRLRLVGSEALASVLLNHAGVQPSMEVLDEPVVHLSNEGVVDLTSYLAERAQSYKRRIFFSDHMSVGGAGFAGTITVVKDEQGSRIQNGTD